MLGIRSRSNLKRKLTSPTTGSSQKRRLTSPYTFDRSASDQSPSPRKIVTSDEGCSPVFSATSFYSPKGQGRYQTPAERQKRRAELGEVLPTKPPVEIKATKTKTKKHQGSVNVSRSRQRTHHSKEKPLLKSKTHTKKKIEPQSKSLDKSTNKKSSPSKKPVNKSPKKSSKKRSPSKRTPRKSPRKGVKKAVKLYLQGLKKNPKFARKGTVISGRRTTKPVTIEPSVEMMEQTPPRTVSKKLDLQDASRSDDGEAKRLDTQVDFCIIAPSPQSSAKKRAMRSKEESLNEVRRSPRKSVKLSPKISQEDGCKVGDNQDKDDELDFLQGFDPYTPDSLTPPVPQEAFPKKAQVATLTAAITPPLSPSNVKLISSSRHNPASSTPIRPKKVTKMKKLIDKDGLEQLTLDLGQKHFGAVTCGMCGMVYTAAHPEDEAVHDKFHRKYLNCIKFRGWKNERMLREFYDGRIIMVLYDDPNYHIKKVEDIRQLVDQELGFLQGENIACKSSCKVLLFITREKKVAGCLIAQEISKGYRVIADQPKETAAVSEEEQQQFEQQRAWCCHTEPEPAVCGVSRIWVASQERRKQIATRMLDCLRNSFTFGTTLPKATLAFSDPTPDGKMLATSYIGTPQFLVYKYH